MKLVTGAHVLWKNMLRNAVQITEQLWKKNSVMCNSVLKYLLWASTEMRALIPYLFCKKVVSVHPQLKAEAVNTIMEKLPVIALLQRFRFFSENISYLEASLPQTCRRRTVESAPHCPSPPGGSQGTGGPDRAGTAAAEEQPLGWTEGKEKEEEEGGARPAQVAGERVETAEGGREDGTEGWRVGVPSLADPSVWRGSGSGEAAEWRKRRDENRQQRVGAAELRWRALRAEPYGGGGRRHLEEGYCGAETGSRSVGGRQGPDLSGSWPQAASAALCFDLEQWKAGGLPW